MFKYTLFLQNTTGGCIWKCLWTAEKEGEKISGELADEFPNKSGYMYLVAIKIFIKPFEKLQGCAKIKL